MKKDKRKGISTLNNKNKDFKKYSCSGNSWNKPKKIRNQMKMKYIKIEKLKKILGKRIKIQKYLRHYCVR
jgi:hypothetical protein